LRDPVLGHDLAAMAAPVTKWSVQVERADELGPILQRAFKIANEAPAGPVFVPCRST
jgi:benzoylformate decarboxylase